MKASSATTIAAFLALATAAVWTSPVSAQTVTGRVEAGGRWWVSLLDDGGIVVEGRVSGVDGGFELPAPEPGRYHVRAERLGHATLASAPVELGGGARRTVALDLEGAGEAPEPLTGPATGESSCRVSPGADTPQGRAWSRARVALAVAAGLAERGDVSLDASVHVRELAPDGHTVERAEPVETHEGVTRLVPALDPEDLVRRGFMREDETGGYRFFAPTPATLISDAFHETHCLRLLPDGGPALVGLAFEPVSRPDSVPDVAGVLWLDAATGGPVLLEFTYRNIDLGIPLGGTGGQTTFAELPDGSWVTAEATLRMPLLSVRVEGEDPDGARWSLVGVREERIRLHRARSGDEAFAFTSPTGVIAGTVLLHADGPALEGAEVRLPGTPFGSVTDAEGRFRVEGLLSGSYAVTAGHPRLDMLPLGTGSEPVDVEEGRASEVVLHAPTPGEAAQTLCGDGGAGPRGEPTGALAGDDDRVVLSGQVVDSVSSEPLAGVPLTLRFRDPRRAGAPHHESRVVSGTGGEFVYCDLPPLAEVRIRAIVPGSDGTRDDVVTAPSSGVLRRQVRVPLTTSHVGGGVFGMVREHGSSRGVQAARLQMQGSETVATTNANGFFAFPDVQPGLHVLEVTALGYQPREAVVQVTGAGAVRVDLSLAAEAIPLEGISVSVVPSRLFGDMVDMQRRMELGFGTFVMRDELERRGGTLATAMRGQGGVQIVRSSERGGGQYAVLRGAMDLTGDTSGQGGIAWCFPAVYMDGQRISNPRSGGVGHEPVDIAVFPVGDIEAVEIYKGSGSVPGEFGGGDAACGVLVIWTRRGGSSVRGSSGGGAGGAPLL